MSHYDTALLTDHINLRLVCCHWNKKKKNIYSIYMKLLVFVLTELGGRGDTVFVKKSVGRNKLLLQGLAVYPSPENKQMFAEELRVRIVISYCH